jgi:hypothetical protein
MYVMYYTSMLRCWQLVRILVKTNHPCLRVGCWRTGEGDQRRGEWESIKIPRWNFASVPKSTWRASLLTRSRLRSYKQATSPQNWVTKSRIMAETWIDVGKNTCETMAIKTNQKLVQALTRISSNTLRACSENHRVKAIRTKKTRVFWSGSSTTQSTTITTAGFTKKQNEKNRGVCWKCRPTVSLCQ